MISSCILNELHSIPDVETVERDALWELRIVGIQNRVGDEVVGVALSMVILSNFQNQALKGLALDGESFESAVKLTENLVYFMENKVRVGHPKSTQNICRLFIAEFDREYLQHERYANKHLKKFQLPDK